MLLLKSEAILIFNALNETCFLSQEACRIFLVPLFDTKIHQIHPGVDLFSFMYWVGPLILETVFQFREIFLNKFINERFDPFSFHIFSLFQTPII